MSHIFISYSHDDSAFASKLANDLLDRGYDVWMDVLNLAGGATWDNEIMQAIDNCSHFVVVWTGNIESSQYSHREMKQALQGGKSIIPLIWHGDPGRLWSEIQQFQWRDFRTDYSAGFAQLSADIPLPKGKVAPPDIKTLVQQGDTTFAAGARLWRSKLQYKNAKGDIFALLLNRSEQGIQSYLVGYADAKITRPSDLQLFLNFSGSVAEDRFEDYLHYIAANDLALWTVLVRGPIEGSSRGLRYALPNQQNIWEKSVKMIPDAVNRVSYANTPFQLFMNAPVALGSAYCASEHFRRSVSIYHINFTAQDDKNRYFLTYEMDDPI